MSLPDSHKTAAFAKIVQINDDDTLRAVSQNTVGLKTVKANQPELLNQAISVLKSGWYSDEDAAAVARIIAVKDAPGQQQFTQDLSCQ